MTDGKKQFCRNDCGASIYVSDRSGKWLPYNWGTDNKHDCPNYKNKQQSTVMKSLQDDRVQLEILERTIRIEELLEATLKNLGLFKTGTQLEDTSGID